MKGTVEMELYLIASHSCHVTSLQNEGLQQQEMLLSLHTRGAAHTNSKMCASSAMSSVPPHGGDQHLHPHHNAHWIFLLKSLPT